MLALALALLAAPVQDAAAPQIPFEKYQLPNGLTVILSEDRRAPVVAVDVWYHVGAANERPGRSGFAHLFEHLMFQGSRDLNGDERTVFAFLERNGATNLNGTTEWDRTNYFETMPRDRLERTLWFESDRMGYLLDTVDQKKLDTQRDVVRNERRQSVENVPYGRAEERLVQLLYPKPHPYYGYVIGSHEDLQAASLEDVRQFFKTYYAPGNASLSIVGDFDKAQARAWVEKYFGPIPAGPPKPPVTFKTQEHTQAQRERLSDNVQLSKILAGYIGPAPLHGQAVQLLMRVLAGGKASRLYDELVYRQKIAQDVSASFDNAMQLGGLIEITATVQAGHTLEEVETALFQEIGKLRDAPPSQEELDRAKRNVQAQLYTALENVGGFGGKADQLNYYEMWAQDPGEFTKNLETLMAVSPGDVQKAAKDYLGEEKKVVIEVQPAGGAK